MLSFPLEHLVGCLVEEGAGLGDHIGHGLLQLGPLLDQALHPEGEEEVRSETGMVAARILVMAVVPTLSQ